MKKILITTLLLFTLILPAYAAMPDLITEEVRTVLNRDSYFVTEPLQPGLSVEDMMPDEDKHAQFFTPEEHEIFIQQLIGKFSGIGVQIQDVDKEDDTNNYIRIVRTIRGSPAVGILQKNDIIIKVEGKDIKLIPMEDTINMLKGEKGTTLTITIKRDNNYKDISIVRDVISVESVSSYVLSDDDYSEEILYVRIELFSQGVGEDLLDHLQYSIREYTTGLILDLRYNPGGLLEEAAKVLDIFINDGLLVELKDKNGNVLYAVNANNFGYPPIKVVVLINEFSASASEVVASGLQDYGIGLLVGTKSYGKGSVQSIYPLPGGYMIKFTTARYFTKSGIVIDEVGLNPDIEIKLGDDENPTFYLDEVEEFDSQIQKAIEFFD